MLIIKIQFFKYNRRLYCKKIEKKIDYVKFIKI